MIIVRTLFELLAVIVMIVGFCNEQRIITWEQKQFKRVKRIIKSAFCSYAPLPYKKGCYKITEIDDYTIILTPIDIKNKRHNCN